MKASFLWCPTIKKSQKKLIFFENLDLRQALNKEEDIGISKQLTN